MPSARDSFRTPRGEALHLLATLFAHQKLQTGRFNVAMVLVECVVSCGAALHLLAIPLARHWDYIALQRCHVEFLCGDLASHLWFLPPYGWNPQCCSCLRMAER